MISGKVLGLTLEAALALLREEGIEPTVVETRAPRTERASGTLRVIRVRENELTVSAFMDGQPGRAEDGVN